jgi:hypothetical protein
VRQLHRLPQRRDRLCRTATFKQCLALQFVKIRITGLRLNQSIDLPGRHAQIGMAIGRNGAGVTRGQAGVAERVAARYRIRPLEKS